MKQLLIIAFACAFSIGNAQSPFKAGMASESIEPGDESFSVALSGYAGPWAGRFAVQWLPEGTLNQHAGISAEQKKTTGKPVKAEGVSYRISAGDHISFQRGKSKDTGTTPPLPGLKSFVVQHPYVYACNGTDTLYRFHIDTPDNGWNRALYANGAIRKVTLQKLFKHEGRLFAANDADSLFSASLIHGSKEEHLYARALAIEENKEKVVILCMDLCGFNSDFIQDVKRVISKKTGTNENAILINASHTHFVPGTQKWLPWAPHNRYPDVNYLYKVVKPAMVRAAVEATSKMFPADISFGRGTTDIGANRSNGTSKEPYDNAVDVLKVESQDKKKQAVMVLTGCHPVFGTKGIRHFTISSNYPGFMRSAVEKAASAPTLALFMQGCAGDINPKDEPEISGQKLADDVQEVLQSQMTPLSGKISFRMDSLLAPTNPWDKKKTEAFKAENAALGGDMVGERNVAWANLMLKHYEKNTMPASMPIYIQTLNIGQWKLIGLSREVVTEYGLAIKKIWPDQLVSVAGYCNDVSSYLPTERHIRTKVYEGDGSYFWYGQPSAFPLDILDRVVNRIRTKGY